MSYVISMLLAFAFAVPAVAGEHHPCYGKAEQQLARELLATMRFLGRSLELQKAVAIRVRHETCGTIALAGRIADLDYSYAFFGNDRNRAIRVAAEARGLNPLKVQAALVDLRWPPKTT